MLRSLPLLLLAALTACAPVTEVPSVNQFVMIDPGKYKTATEKELAQQLAENECKSNALAASAAVHKAVASGNAQNGLVHMRARKKADEMYSAALTACMNKAGFLLKAK